MDASSPLFRHHPGAAEGTVTVKTQRLTLAIDDLHGADVMRIEQALAVMSGIVRVYVNLAMEMTYIEYDPQLVGIEQIVTAVERAGFHPGRPTMR